MPTPRPPYAPFYRCEESISGSLLSRRYSAAAAFSCEDYEEFKAQLQALQDEIAEWLTQRGKKASGLALAVQAHPWIHGRILEAMRRLRGENSPLGMLSNQAEVTLHLYSEDEPVGQFLQISGKNGKAPPEAADRA